MRPEEIALAAEWAAVEGWNPGLADAACFATVDPDGFLVGELDGEAAATISCLNYDERFAFLGFYIVRSDLRGRGYGMAPDPNDAKAAEKAQSGANGDFQVHANSAAVPYDALMRKIGELRKLGAKRISITIPGERPTDLARGIRFASEAKLDLLTIAAGHPQMLEIADLICSSLNRLQKRGDFVPDIALEADVFGVGEGAA